MKFALTLLFATAYITSSEAIKINVNSFEDPPAAAPAAPKEEKKEAAPADKPKDAAAAAPADAKPKDAAAPSDADAKPKDASAAKPKEDKPLSIQDKIKAKVEKSHNDAIKAGEMDAEARDEGVKAQYVHEQHKLKAATDYADALHGPIRVGGHRENPIDIKPKAGSAEAKNAANDAAEKRAEKEEAAKPAAEKAAANAAKD